MTVKILGKEVEMNFLGLLGILTGLELYIRLRDFGSWTKENFVKTKWLIKTSVIFWPVVLIGLNFACWFYLDSSNILAILSRVRALVWLAMIVSYLYVLYRAAILFGAGFLAETFIFGVIKTLIRLIPGNPPEAPDLITAQEAKEFFGEWFVGFAGWMIVIGHVLAFAPIYKNPFEWVLLTGAIVTLLILSIGWLKGASIIPVIQKIIVAYFFLWALDLVIRQIFWKEFMGDTALSTLDFSFMTPSSSVAILIFVVAILGVLIALVYNVRKHSLNGNSEAVFAVALVSILLVAAVLVFGGRTSLAIGQGITYLQNPQSIFDGRPTNFESGKQAIVSENAIQLIVPQNQSSWASGGLKVKKGEIIEIVPMGTVQARSDGPVVKSRGETTGYCDYGVDSKYVCNVGGLEMGIGSNAKSERILLDGPKRIVAKADGSMNFHFRTIDRLDGYRGTGAFAVTIRKVK